MKKLKVLIPLMFMVLFVASCSLIDWDEIESLDVTPTLFKKVPRLYPGGNVDCSQLEFTGLIQTTGRNDYDPSTNSFKNGWPSGLYVKVDNGKSVAFQIDGALDFGDGKCYKVGAVIVKGGNASNVYNYVDIGGATMDKGLVSPINASGAPAGLSNLTFCFIEVECPKPQVTAAKILYLPVGAEYSTSAVSNGDLIFNVSTGNTWCNYMGINKYPEIKEFLFLRRLAVDPIAKGTITETETSITVQVEMFEGKGQLLEFFFYIGDVQGLGDGTTSCPDYNNWPRVVSNNGITATYTKMK